VSAQEPRPAAAPSPSKRDDRLTLATIALGAATALLGIRAPLTLVTGVALGLAGVLLAVRGDRRVSGPRLMTAALAIAVVAVLAVAVLGLYEEWLVGQRLAEGAAPGYVMAAMRPYARARAGLRAIALFSSLAMLLGACVTRVSGK
jgi:hypothetical protein